MRLHHDTLGQHINMAALQFQGQVLLVKVVWMQRISGLFPAAIRCRAAAAALTIVHKDSMRAEPETNPTEVIRPCARQKLARVCVWVRCTDPVEKSLCCNRRRAAQHKHSAVSKPSNQVASTFLLGGKIALLQCRGQRTHRYVEGKRAPASRSFTTEKSLRIRRERGS